MQRNLLFFGLLGIGLAAVAGVGREAIANEIPLSVAERSGYTRTATEAEIDELLDATANADKRMLRWTMGQSHEGRPIQAIKIGFDKDPPADTAGTGKRLTVIIIGGIHSGECAGKEAMFEVMRSLAMGGHSHWLESLRLVIIPSLSPDSNSRRAVDNRPGQLGPSEGMGTRANAQGLDLNRDFIKLESPEIRALVSAMNQFDADVLIDLHTTNGSQHRYELTYDPPHHPLTPAAVRDFLRNQLLPEVTEKADKRGISLFYYGNFDRSHTRWITYGYEARYSTNYMGLRGKLGILSEAYSYATYPKRIEASRVFVEEILDYMSQHQEGIRQALSAEPSLVPGSEIALTARLNAFPEAIKVRGYRPDTASSGVEREAYDYEVQFYGDFKSEIKSTLPKAYFVQVSEPRAEKIAELLKLHGVQTERRQLGESAKCEAFLVAACQEASQAFQGHRMVSLEGVWHDLEPGKEPGKAVDGIWVDCAQPLAAVAATILEPESADSIATWNLIPANALQPGMQYPVVRVLE